MNNENDVIEINLADLFLYMLHRWYVFVIVVLLTLAAGLSICFFVITPQYESTTKIIILSRQDTDSLTYSDMQLASQLTKDYEELIKSRDVLESVIEECSLEDNYNTLLKRVTVENVTDTRIISITVEDPSPEMAREIANSIREISAKLIQNGTDVKAVNVVDAANLPTEQSSPSVRLWAVLSALVGFLAVFIVEAVLALSDDTIKTSDDVEKYLGLPTLAMIPRGDTGDSRSSDKKKKKRKFVKRLKAALSQKRR